MKLSNVNYSRRSLKLSLFGGILIAIIFLFLQYVPIDENRISFYSSHPTVKQLSLSGVEEPRKDVKPFPIILLWTTLYKETNWAPNMSNLNCPVNCQVTSNRTLLNASSAVVFHLRSADVHDLPPRNRNRFQKWVLLNREAPTNTEISVIQALEGKIHWTATYRHDSDFYTPYGKIVATNITQASEGRNIVENKTHLVCWIVSHCRTSSHRESYVRVLSQYIPIAIFGQCGSSSCPEGSAENCYKHISKKCKFYLSFENSICTEYVTEKLFNALETDMVPIVMGGANYSHILPNNSYINIVDFMGPKALADYLLELNSNPKEFQAYHMWKMNYKIIHQEFQWMCDLCQKLHKDSGAVVSTYEYLSSWWFNQNCPTWVRTMKYHWK